jgi:GNAT superfamily N-acetyltransferase
MLIRSVQAADIPQIARLRSREWETVEYWTIRIRSYLSGEDSPREALASRAVFVAMEGDELVGFIAGHRTQRFGCEGELQWINVAKEKRAAGIADKLIAQLGAWFVEHGISRICVDVVPENTVARKLYMRCGASPLKPHWMVWDDARTMCDAGRGSGGSRVDTATSS